jgi:FAD/FMN-containing dehydrogenase
MQLQAASSETVDATVLALARQDAIWLKVQRLLSRRSPRACRGREHRRIRRPGRSGLAAQLEKVEAVLAGGGSGRRGYTVARDPAAAAAIWSMRKKSVGLLGNMQGERRPMPFVEDTVVPPEHLADYIREFRAALDNAAWSTACSATWMPAACTCDLPST